MPGKTKIGWTHPTYNGIQYEGRSWNPMTGCEKVSPGCDNCYAATFAERFRGAAGNYYEHGFDLQLRPQHLETPLTWKKPACIFVNSMSDWCYEDAPDEYILKMFDVMLTANHHIYQLLTKRAPRMERLVPQIRESIYKRTGSRVWPWHIWCGVTIESYRQRGRLTHLKEVPAPVRFVSYEPAIDAFTPFPERRELDGIQWIICGGESGPHARLAKEWWFEQVQEQCQQTGTAFFIKQMGTAWMREHYPEHLRADSKGEDWDFWPSHLRIREYPSFPSQR